MKNYKSYLCFILAIVLLFSLAACGKPANTGDADSATSAADDGTSTPEPDADAAFSYSEGLDENGFWVGITGLEYVTGLEYKNITIPSDVHKITDDKVQAEIDTILTEYAESTDVTEDRAIVDGDTVNIDYVGSVGGVEFEGGNTKGAGAEVIIGVTNYIDDFLQQLIGHKVGDKFDINVTFPENYGQEDLNGKDAVFATTVNKIIEKKTPELTDAFVSEKLSETQGWKTVAEMKDGIYKGLQRESIQSYIQQILTDTVTAKPVPESLLQYQVNSLVEYYKVSAEQYGVTLDEFLASYVGVASIDEIIANNAEYNEKTAKYFIAVQAVAEDLKMTITTEDLVAYFTEVTGNPDYAQYEEQYGLPYLKQAALCQMVSDYIKENATMA